MTTHEGNLLMALTGGSQLKLRVQHPKVHERKDRKGSYWFFRYRHDEILPFGAIKTKRKFHIIGRSKGEGALAKKQAESMRDTFLAGLNAAPTKPEAAVAAQQPGAKPNPGDILFGMLAELWRTDYVEKVAAGKAMIANSTKAKYKYALRPILLRLRDTRINQIRAKDVLDWLYSECTSWCAMADFRNIMSGIITKAQEWEIYPDTFANPIRRVKLPKKWEVREKRILAGGDGARAGADDGAEPADLRHLPGHRDANLGSHRPDDQTRRSGRAPSGSNSATGAATSTSRRRPRAGASWRSAR